VPKAGAPVLVWFHGNAGNISAYWAGFRDYRAAGLIGSLPRMWGFQAAGAAPIVLGHPVEAPDTVATAIRIGNPASWAKATAARDESGGRIDAVTDDEILSAYRDLARLEGIFCEPASAASVAGVRKAVGDGRVDPEAIVVAVLVEGIPPLALLGCLPFWFAVPAIRWAVSRPQEPVPMPALAGNVIWNLATNALIAVGLGLAALMGW